MIAVWFVVTIALTIVLIIFPGITGMNEIRAMDRQPADLTIQVEGRRFFWKATYLESSVSVSRTTD